MRSAEKVLEQGRRVITHAEAETRTESGMEGKTQLPLISERMTALLKHDLYRSCICCSQNC